MERYTIILLTDAGWVDDFVTFAKTYDEAISNADDYIVEQHEGRASIIQVEMSDILFDIDDLGTFGVNKNSHLYSILRQITDEFEYILRHEPENYMFIRSCAASIYVLMSYVNKHKDPFFRSATVESKKELNDILKCILLDCQALSERNYTDRVVDLITELYIKYAAKTVYNYKRED